MTPDVLPSHQHHCNVDKWWSLDVRCGGDRPPTMEMARVQLCHRDALISGPVTQTATVRMLHVGKYSVDMRVWIAVIHCGGNGVLVGNKCCRCHNVTGFPKRQVLGIFKQDFYSICPLCSPINSVK